jgi:chromosome segregation ATPase
MTEDLIILKEKHSELERRHSEVVTSTNLQFGAILTSIKEINYLVHGLDTRIQLFQREIQSVQSDAESGKRRVLALEEETEGVSSGLLRLRIDHDNLSGTLNKRDPVTMWTSIGAAVTAVGAIIAIWVSAFHGGK